MLTRIIRYQTLPSRSHHQALLFYQSCCFLKIASIASNKMCWKGKPGSGGIMASVLGICSVNNNNNNKNHQQPPTTTNHQQPPITTNNHQQPPQQQLLLLLLLLLLTLFFSFRFPGNSHFASRAPRLDFRIEGRIQLFSNWGVFLRKKKRYQNDHVIGVFWVVTWMFMEVSKWVITPI